MAWKKLGRILDPDSDWVGSHAQVPTSLVLDDVVRVFISTRNAQGKSLCYAVDLDRHDPLRVVARHREPCLGFGVPGTFDDEGVMPSYALKRDGRTYLYYSGWNQRLTVPYHNAMGVAVSDDDGLSFRKLFEGPIMDRTATEPYLAVTPTVLFDEGLWKMWYVSGTRWLEVNGKYEPLYVIKYAESEDGYQYTRFPEQCLESRFPTEAFSRPCVIREDGLFKMWFCSRASEDYRDGAGSYRIRYAESVDGRTWTRFDDEGIPPSVEGWDSQMTCYPFIFESGGHKYMLYNGNRFGTSGFGLAQWSDDE